MKINKKGVSAVIIIAIVLLVAVATTVVVLLFNGYNKNNNSNKTGGNTDTNNKNTSNKEDIVQMDISNKSAIALTDSGKLYVIGYKQFLWGGYSKPLTDVTLFAENVKQFANGGNYYISNNNELYITGVRPSGGSYDGYEKIGENIKKVDGNGLGCIALGNDGYLYAFGQANYNGMGVELDTLTKIESISNVSDIYMDLALVYYLTDNNELYAKMLRSDKDAVKVLDNVVACEARAITTKDGSIYKIDWNDKLEKVTCELQENADGVITFPRVGLYPAEQYYTINGIIPNEADNVLNHYKDVKEMMFKGSSSVYGEYWYTVYKVIYLATDGKIKLSSINPVYSDGGFTSFDEESKTVEYTIDNLKEIYKFALRED